MIIQNNLPQGNWDEEQFMKNPLLILVIFSVFFFVFGASIGMLIYHLFMK